LGATVDSDGAHQRAEPVVAAIFSQSFTDFPRNYTRAEIGLDTDANIFEAGAQTA